MYQESVIIQEFISSPFKAICIILWQWTPYMKRILSDEVFSSGHPESTAYHFDSIPQTFPQESPL